MAHMTRSVVWAAVLGILVGVALGSYPWVQPPSAPRAQLLMAQAGHTNAAFPTFQAAPGPGLEPLLIAVLVGLVIAIPVFLLARRRAY